MNNPENQETNQQCNEELVELVVARNASEAEAQEVEAANLQDVGEI